MATIYMVSELFPASLDRKWEAVKKFFESYYRDPLDPKKPFRFKQKPTDEQIREWYQKISQLKEEVAAQVRRPS